MNLNDIADDKLREFKEAFQMFDKDQDSLLEIQEAIHAYMCLGYEIPVSELTEFLKDTSSNFQNISNLQSKNINFEIFVQFINKRPKETEIEEELMDCFKEFDKDRDGKISVKELKYLLISLGEELSNEEIEEIVRELDTRNEGGITYKDFIRLMLSK
jgi:Ca2+-binding EF-hand superfamily protein